MFMFQMNCHYVTFVCTIFWEGVIRWISSYFLIIFWYFWGNLYGFSCLARYTTLLDFLAVFIIIHIHYFTFLFICFIYYSFCVIFSIKCYCLTWNNSFIWCVAFDYWWWNSSKSLLISWCPRIPMINTGNFIIEAITTKA